MRASAARRRTRAGLDKEVERAPHLVFRVAGEEYALPLIRVREIVRLGSLAAVPKAPPALRGVMSLRDEQVAVVELAAAFGARQAEDTPETCALIVTLALDGPPTLVGLVVSSVSCVLGFAPDEIAPPPRVGALVTVDIVGGIARMGQDLVPILNLDRLLDSEEIRTAARAAMASAATRGLPRDPIRPQEQLQ